MVTTQDILTNNLNESLFVPQHQFLQNDIFNIFANLLVQDYHWNGKTNFDVTGPTMLYQNELISLFSSVLVLIWTMFFMYKKSITEYVVLI